MSKQKEKELPPGWAITRLGDLGDYINGRGFKKSEWGQVGRPIIRIQDLTGSNDRPNFFDGEVEERHVVEPGAFLISWAATLGAYIWKGPEAVLNQHIFKVCSFIDKQFHVWLVHHVLADMRVRAHGTGMVHITKGEFDATRVLLPPLAEQVRIAETLDELFSDIDAGVATLERLLIKLKHFRATVLKAAVEGALTVEWRAQHPDSEPASVLANRIFAERRRRWEDAQLAKFKEAEKEPPRNWKAKYQEPAAPDTTDLPELMHGRIWVSLDQIAEIVGGVTKGQKFTRVDRVRSVAYLRVANVQRGYLDLDKIKDILATEKDIEALKLQLGDILFNEGGDRDKLGRGWIWENQIAECIHQNHVFRARLVSSEIPPKLASWCGNSYGQRWFMRTGKQSVNLASINLTVLRSFPIPLAPAAEQQAIVEAVEAQLSVIDHLEADLAAKLKSARALRQSILRDAFAGKLVPQDSNDEPAAELLARIAAERAERTRTTRSTKPRQARPKRVTKPRRRTDSTKSFL